MIKYIKEKSSFPIANLVLLLNLSRRYLSYTLARNQTMGCILIVDDSKTEIKFITKILENIGYEVDYALNGEEGVQKTKELQPDLVLMDVIMPGINGYQATRQITTSPDTQSIPVVIVSALKTENDRVWGKMMGAKGYLGKPFKKNELLEEIKKQLNPLKKIKTLQLTTTFKI